jgi:hypothetical protein
VSSYARIAVSSKLQLSLGRNGIDLSQADPLLSALTSIMVAIMFRCPNTGSQVQGWIAEDVTDAGENTYESTSCHACGRMHWINPRTGRVIGQSDE